MTTQIRHTRLRQAIVAALLGVVLSGSVSARVAAPEVVAPVTVAVSTPQPVRTPVSPDEVICPAGLIPAPPSVGLLSLPVAAAEPVARWNVLVVEAALAPVESDAWTSFSGAARTRLRVSMRSGLALTEHGSGGNLEINTSWNEYPVVVSKWLSFFAKSHERLYPDPATLAPQFIGDTLDTVDVVVLLVPTNPVDAEPIDVGYFGLAIGNPAGFPDGTELIVLPVTERIGDHSTVLVHELLHLADFRLETARQEGRYVESGIRVEADPHAAACYDYRGDELGADWNAWYAALLSGAELGQQLADGTRLTGIDRAAWAAIGSQNRTMPAARQRPALTVRTWR